MGFRFKKSVNLGSGVRLNMSNKGIGVSAGVKGLRVSHGADGKTRLTASLPNTGISYQKTLSSAAPTKGIKHQNTESIGDLENDILDPGNVFEVCINAIVLSHYDDENELNQALSNLECTISITNKQFGVSHNDEWYSRVYIENANNIEVEKKIINRRFLFSKWQEVQLHIVVNNGYFINKYVLKVEDESFADLVTSGLIQEKQRLQQQVIADENARMSEDEDAPIDEITSILSQHDFDASDELQLIDQVQKRLENKPNGKPSYSRVTFLGLLGVIDYDDELLHGVLFLADYQLFMLTEDNSQLFCPSGLRRKGSIEIMGNYVLLTDSNGNQIHKLFVPDDHSLDEIVQKIEQHVDTIHFKRARI